MLKEFKEFAVKGNVIDLAVGVIIGAAFGTIVKSLVEDIIMPPLGYILGNVDFSNLYVTIKDGLTPGPYNTASDAMKAGAIIIKYGAFINTLVSFLIVAFAIFLIIKQINRFKKEEQTSPPSSAPTKAEALLGEIRDLLRTQGKT